MIFLVKIGGFRELIKIRLNIDSNSQLKRTKLGCQSRDISVGSKIEP